MPNVSFAAAMRGPKAPRLNPGTYRSTVTAVEYAEEYCEGSLSAKVLCPAFYHRKSIREYTSGTKLRQRIVLIVETPMPRSP